MTAIAEVELAALRPRLTGYCYQMLGSPFDAEDAVQDVLERVWRSRRTFDPTQASLSTWSLRIAHNVCVDRLRGAARRPLPRDLSDPGIDVGAPLVPAFDVPWLMPAPRGWFGEAQSNDPLERAADVRFAVTAVLQTLPARQRGVFLLRVVMGCSAAETATVLDSSVAAVNSALQRARLAVGREAARPRALRRDRVERYARAIERADLQALVALVADDVVLEMPPVPAWSRGREDYRAFMAHLFTWRGTEWATRLVEAHGQPAMLIYRVTGDGPVPHTVQLVDADASGDSDALSHVFVYADPRLFSLFEAYAGAAPTRPTDESAHGRS